MKNAISRIWFTAAMVAFGIVTLIIVRATEPAPCPTGHVCKEFHW